jgi:hypothetical protein
MAGPGAGRRRSEDAPRGKPRDHLALRRRYKGHIARPWSCLLVAAAATLAIPGAFRLIIDRGFSGGRRHQPAGSNICS